jgi:hypothetical protein
MSAWPQRRPVHSPYGRPSELDQCYLDDASRVFARLTDMRVQLVRVECNGRRQAATLDPR